ncbi:hypothetical protein B0H67DRAFT_553233 [Lasiosphaeris hirsuta]|uniref:Uncharacterized protein n=1 Tax=Lasiosphaeris hirsuta TaxID=260670 RepID=A0AA40AET0_9PEZI|nr:hypothetical protein B0H67DRAFT_553233 [Lasiosphaeris hirsuta]
MPGDQKQSGGSGTNDFGGDSSASSGRIFITQYKATPQYKRDKNKYQAELHRWDDMLDILRKSNSSEELINEAKVKKRGASLQQEILIFKAPLNGGEDLSPEHRNEIKTYLEELRAELKQIGGSEL